MKRIAILLIVAVMIIGGCTKKEEKTNMKKIDSTILPRVKEQYMSDKYFTLGKKVTYYLDKNMADVGISSLEIFLPELELTRVDTSNADIYFKYDASVSDKEEYYELHVGEKGIQIVYKDYLGARNASSTIALLAEKDKDSYKVPVCTIKDYPDSMYRSGLLESSGRAWKDIDEIKEDLVRMALAKMNYMNFHFFDYMGSSIRYDSYPMIKGFGKDNRQYTKDEIRDLVAFAKKLGIEIVPGIEMPAHAQAILEAMPGLRCNGDIPNIWVLCAGNEMTYTVLDNIIKETAELFPGKYIHIGADELDFGDDTSWQPAWMGCSRCASLRQKEDLDSERDIFYYMIERIYASVKSHGKQMIMFNDQIDISVPVDLPRDIIIHFWRIAIPGRGPVEGCSLERFLEEGFTVINSYYPETYVDFEYYAKEETIRLWTPLSSPEFDKKYASQIMGGEFCAWEGQPHLRYTLPSSITMYADRLWNHTVCDYDNDYGKMMTRLILGINTPKNFNVFKYLGSVLPPRDDVNKAYLDKIKADDEELVKARDNLLRSLKDNGGYGSNAAAVYMECIDWVLENR